MSKTALGNVDLNVSIERIKPTQDEVRQYIKFQQTAFHKGLGMSLNEYLKEHSEYKGTNTIVVGDLSNLTFGEENMPPPMIDVRYGNFSGCILKNTKFYNCDLSYSEFRNTNLHNTKFGPCMLKEVDFRGSDLDTCIFSEEYKKNPTYSQNVKLSVNEEHAIYTNLAKVQEPLLKKELDNLIREKTIQANESYNKLRWFSRFREDPETLENYYTLTKEIEELEKKQLQVQLGLQKNPIDISYLNIINQTTKYDAVYRLDSDKKERDQKQEYVRLTREDIKNYLTTLKTSPGLSLNDFAKQKFASQKNPIDPDTRYIADCSSFKDPNNPGRYIETDLSGLVFDGVDFSNSNFSGARFGGCIFKNSKIEGANFEGAKLLIRSDAGYSRGEPVMFDNVDAKFSRFSGADMEDIEIKNSRFPNAIFPYSNATYSKLHESDFNFTNIRNGNWSSSDINGCTFNFSDLSDIALQNSHIEKSQFQQTILTNALIQNSEIIKSDFTKSIMKNAKLIKTKITDTILQDIQGTGMDLTDTDMYGFTTLEGADLEKAILDYVKAKDISFRKANLDGIKARFCDLTRANLNDATARFADLQHAILDKAEAHRVDWTGSNWNDLNAIEANFTGGIMEFVKSTTTTNIDNAITEGCNMRNTTLKNRISAQVNEAKRAIKIKEQQQSQVKNAAVAPTFLVPLPPMPPKATGPQVQPANTQLQSANIQASNLKPAILSHTEPNQQANGQSNLQVLASTAAYGIGTFGKIRQKINDFTSKTIGSKWGRNIGIGVGAVGGAVLALGLAPITGGASVLVPLVVLVATTVVGGTCGGFIGHKIGKYIGIGAPAMVAASAASAFINAPASTQPMVTPLQELILAGTFDGLLNKTTGKGLAEHMISIPTALCLIGAHFSGISGVLGGPLSNVALYSSALGGAGLDKLVEYTTGKKIAEHGDKLITVLQGKCHEYAGELSQLSPEYKKWLVETNMARAEEINYEVSFNDKLNALPTVIQDQQIKNEMAASTNQQVPSLQSVLDKAKISHELESVNLDTPAKNNQLSVNQLDVDINPHQGNKDPVISQAPPPSKPIEQRITNNNFFSRIKSLFTHEQKSPQQQNTQIPKLDAVEVPSNTKEVPLPPKGKNTPTVEGRTKTNK